MPGVHVAEDATAQLELTKDACRVRVRPEVQECFINEVHRGLQREVASATVPIRSQRQRTDDSGSKVVPGCVHDGNIRDVMRDRVVEDVARHRMSGFEQPRDHQTVRRHGQRRKERPDQFGGDCSLLGSSYLMELVAVRALAGNDVARKMGQPAELITCWAVVDRRADWQTDVENAEAFDAVDDGKPQVFATFT